MSRQEIATAEVESAMQKLVPDDYLTELQHSHLNDIRLTLLDVRGPSSGFSIGDGPLRLKITRLAYMGANESSYSSLTNEYIIEGFHGRKNAIRIKATFELILASDSILSKEFLMIYSRNSADMQAWPYLRELTQSLTGRMGLPGLVLPLLKDASQLDIPAKAEK